MTGRRRGKGRTGLARRAVGGIYSWAAGRVYDEVVAKRALPLLGGRIGDLVLDNGRAAAGTAAGRAILDMPVGTAYFTIDMARRHDGLVVGCDIAAGMVREAAVTARAAGIANLAVVQADAHCLPFRDGAFGAVVSSNGLQVIPGLEPTIAELVRVLDMDAILYIAAVALALPAPARVRRRVPGFLRDPRDVTRVLERRGLSVAGTTRTRLGYALTARRA